MNCKKRLSKELNVLITSAIILLSLYITFVSVLERPLFAPLSGPLTKSQVLLHDDLTNTTNKTAFFISTHNINSSIVNNNESVITTDNGTHSNKFKNNIIMQQQKQNNDDGKQKNDAVTFISSFFSLFFFWFLALVAGRISHYARLPPLLGMLLVGILFANIPSLKQILIVHPSWNQLARSIAFVLILLRCGIGLNPEVLRRSLLFCTSMGVFSTIFEVMVILLIARFFYNVPMSIATLFGFVLASTSPAVTVPTMIQLQHQHRGTDKGIPTMALASASIDNIFCITGFAITYAIVSASDEQLRRTIILVPVQIYYGLILGCLIGGILRFFPSPNAKNSMHFHRVLLLCSLSLALYFGTKAINFAVSGPISVMLACFLAGSGWKKDNAQGTRIEAEALRILWNQLLLPLLFVLIGLVFDFSIFTWDLLEKALFIISIGLIARALSVILIVKLCTNSNNDNNSDNVHLNVKECIFFSSIFMPKATVQAALAPVLFDFAMSQSSTTTSTGNIHSQSTAVAEFTLQACILSILLTAPIGQLLIQILGRKFLACDEKMLKSGKGGSKRQRNLSKPVFVIDAVQEKKEADEEQEMEADIYAEKNEDEKNEDRQDGAEVKI